MGETFTDPRVPAHAQRVPVGRWLPVTEIRRDDQVLNFHNIIFMDGGSVFWFEEPNVLAVMHAQLGGEIRRYEGVWEPCNITPPETAPEVQRYDGSS